MQKENGSWVKTPAKEARLSGLENLLAHRFGGEHSQKIKRNLSAWWNPKGGNTPNWDIASTCNIKGESGLLLVEAKAHQNEPDSSGKKKPDKNATCGKRKNHAQIGQAIAEAANGLQSVTGKPWKISRDKHYQISNRFAWSWKIATLGIPVVLLYLGFLNAEDMADNGPLFRSEKEWDCILKDHCHSVVDNTCWRKCLNVNGVPFFPLIRTFDQPFQP